MSLSTREPREGQGSDHLLNEQLPQAVVTDGDDGVVVVDENGVVRVINDNAAALLEIKNASAVGHSLTRLGDPSKMLFDMRDAQKTVNEIIMLNAVDGRSKRNVQVRITPFQTSEQLFFFCNLRDLTWKTELERRVTQQERRYNSLVENSPLAVFSCDLTGTITAANAHVPALLGLPPDTELAGMSLNAVPVIGTSGISRSINHCLESGKSLVSSHLMADGPRGPIQFTGHFSPLTLDVDQTVGVHVVIEDTTERERTRSSLAMSEERHRVFFEHAPISLWETDFSAVLDHFDTLRARGVVDFDSYLAHHPDDLQRCLRCIRIVSVNPASLILYEARTAEELSQVWPARARRPGSYEGYRELFAVLADGRMSCRFETEDTTLLDKTMSITISAAVAPGYEADLSKVFLSILDITKIKEMERALQLQLVLERLITRISARFVSLPVAETSAAIGRALEEIGQALDVDRVAAYAIGAPGEFQTTHQWQRGNVADAEPFEAHSLLDCRWFAARMALLETIHLQSPRDLPPEAAAERQLLEQCGVEMLLMIPQVVRNELVGFLCIRAGAESGIWSEDIVSLLRVVADVISSAIDRERRDRELREQEDLLRTVFNSMGSGLVVTDRENTVLLINPVALEYLQIEDATALIGKRLDEVVPPASPLLRTVRPGEHQQVLLNLAGQSTRVVGYTNATVSDGQQRIIVFRDLTNIIESEQRQKRAEQLASLGMMVAKLSHEIKNPLTSILLGLSSLGESSSLRSDENFILHSVLDEVRFLKTLIGNLLDSTRLEDVAPQATYIERVVRECVNAQVHLAAHKGIALNVDEGPLGARLLVDQKVMARALVNLVQNALEACKRGDEVRVGWRWLAEGEKKHRLPGFPREVLCLFIEDSGPGIPQEVLDKLFVPFTTTKAHGVGLGLPMVREAVRGHGGVIDVFTGAEAKMGGTRFEILLAGGDRPSCLEVHGSCDASDCEECPVPEGCPVREKKAFYACWAIKGRASWLERGSWNTECQTCEAYLAGNLEIYHRRRETGRPESLRCKLPY